ncbi:helix-turn-helix transcriptional regulator [Kitasatospora sp. MAA19]|uniref:helix-turn-helix domain-containing protein n=1 Tax=Kitasatospora sp. MAA19 TaxID=3035090 RepID=UPI002476C671|nr:helix-turn-helix transcriptional regulator [Kitasatospora sp. MAA19]
MDANTPPPRRPGARTLSDLQRFAAYLRTAALRAGYDVVSPRGGGKSRLAHDSGISLTTISRVLAGTRALDPASYEGLARALRVPLRELMVEGGIVPSESLPGWPDHAVRSRPITPDEAADELGITDPVDRQMFLAMVDRLRRDRAAERDGSNGGKAAEA